ncbi:MAG: YggS family pyridoxal phosphate-dependent enzyme [Coxiellaceae bacterium]|nr:MAG: YggS family pyridoxal phosphate-dependent enzyme [Coxiellaceae bacterium]
MRTIADNLYHVLNEITAVTKQILPASIMPPILVAVSKTKPVDAILAAYQAGQQHFGENKVQEALQKFVPLRQRGLNLTLHLIGPLQTNKVADAVSLFDVIHTLDREKLAIALKNEMQVQQRYPRLLVQVNVGREPQKAGIMPENAATFVEECRAMGLPIQGLMCIPPVNTDPRPHFEWLQNSAHKLNLPELSIGMSNDYKLAIQYQATYVRVGTAIFGARENKTVLAV